MKENNNLIIKGDTKIVFSIKNFFGLIGTILIIFLGFYQLVIVPNLNKIDRHYEMMIIDQQKQNRLFYNEINNINTSINTLNTSIEILNIRKGVKINDESLIINSGKLSTTPTQNNNSKYFSYDDFLLDN